MSLIRTIIVDDSAFVRKVVREMLGSSPHIEVVGMARDGNAALEMVESLKPDVVTCDLEMPELDGVGFVRAQMERKPVPILILTASPQDGARVLEALEAGAVDFLQKPTALANENLLSIRAELVAKVKAAALAPSQALHPALPAAAPISSPSPKTATNFDIVVLGISTGGPQALRFLIPQFAVDFPVPLVIVLHMPVGYTAIFAEKLSEISRVPVREASEGCPVRAGEVLLAQAGFHLSFKRAADGSVTAHLSTHPMDTPHRPAVDVLFKSAAEIYGNRVLAVVMTGMGEDGKEGAAWVKAQGGMVLTESESSCIIYGMPRSVVESGLSDCAFPLETMASEIIRKI